MDVKNEMKLFYPLEIESHGMLEWTLTETVRKNKSWGQQQQEKKRTQNEQMFIASSNIYMNEYTKLENGGGKKTSSTPLCEQWLHFVVNIVFSLLVVLAVVAASWCCLTAPRGKTKQHKEKYDEKTFLETHI